MSHRLLVANRGEIALRIFRACRDLGIETVAVFSDADRLSPHVAAADHAVRLGPAPASESYLSVPALLEAARRTRATLVHPGYGFLAENAPFARACRESGLRFVGPSPEAMEAMGTKTGSRQLMKSVGVPVVPGTAEAAGPKELTGFAREVGYPILLKASAGGGGKGMRRVDAEKDLEAAFARVTSEAELSFADRAVYAEKLIDRPRHVEVQVVGDTHGTVVTVGERECSIQRRHQKVVEECPSPAVTPALRAALCRAAADAARAVRYDSCGTVEFLLAPDGSFYFLEMNTRLQVEHPITEEVWGVDLVTEMIAIALGERISFDPAELSPRGHAIECRVYAEDPFHGFAPSPGRIEHLRLPEGPGVRNDVGIEQGSVVPVHYDPMLGKLIVHGADREEARRRLARALTEYELTGIESTLPLFRRLLADPEFERADFDVQWLDRQLAAGWLERSPAGDDDVLLGAVALTSSNGTQAPETSSSDGRGHSTWREAARREGLRGQ
ncbi:MAG: ATP-grasp domain-containing protein [Thermoanaerobaculia bacterium]|nr:ATP-grasp domain-containing protein [Thermoanaerobaculia bacterium]